MVKMKEISIYNLNESTAKLIGKDWMLITSGSLDKGYNTMTASWGGMGVLWNKPVSFIFIRPQRYTYEFVEKNDRYTVSFFDENYRSALTFCGKNSGRDYDKAKETGLTPVEAGESVSFKEARLILVCKKLYLQDLKPDGFLFNNLISDNYPNKDFHRMYVGEIEKAFIKE